MTRTRDDTSFQDQARRLLVIDKYNLDQEWEEQATLYFDLAVNLADARAAVDRAKAELDLVEAEADKDVRLHPEKYGVEKITEASVKAAVLASKQRRAAYEDWVVAKHDAAVADAAVSACDHRKRALEKEVDLFLANYFARPRTDRDSAEALDDRRKRKARGTLGRADR
jgi:hypothetical protein